MFNSNSISNLLKVFGTTFENHLVLVDKKTQTCSVNPYGDIKSKTNLTCTDDFTITQWSWI
jgi:hypothetical protein